MKVKITYQNDKTEDFDIYEFEDTDPECLLQNGIVSDIKSVTIEVEQMNDKIEAAKVHALIGLLEVVAKTS